MGVLYASGQVGQLSLTKTDGDALIAKPYRSEDIIRGLKIVDIVLTDDASGPIPNGLSVLAGSHRNISSSLGLTHNADGISDFSATELNDWIRRLRLQQTELLSFSNYTLSEADMGKLMLEGIRVCAACLGTPTVQSSEFVPTTMRSSPTPHSGCAETSRGVFWKTPV